MILNNNEIETLETRYRANLINSLGGFKSLVLVGSKNKNGISNLAPFSSLFHLGAHPALCGLIFRPKTETSSTLQNIIDTNYFTINQVNPTIYKQAHQCSAKYSIGISEFSEVQLNEENYEDVNAPFVKESIIKWACEFVQKIEIEINGTTILIGKIIKIIAPDYFIKSDGFIDIEEAQTVTCSGLDSYHTTQKLARLSYAKVGKPVFEI